MHEAEVDVTDEPTYLALLEEAEDMGAAYVEALNEQSRRQRVEQSTEEANRV